MVKSWCSFPNVTIKLNQETFSSCRYWFLGGCRIFEYGYYGTKTGKELILYHTRSLQVRIVCVPSLGKSQLQWENTKFSFPGFKKKTLFTWQLFTCFSENGPLLLCSSTFGLSYRNFKHLEWYCPSTATKSSAWSILSINLQPYASFRALAGLQVYAQHTVCCAPLPDVLI